MKKNYSIALFAIALLPVASYANLELAQKNGCTACHAIDKKVLGPAYQDVAKKYKSDKEAEAKLVASIRQGGAGKWGAIPMPPQSALSEKDTKTLAKWILSTAK